MFVNGRIDYLFCHFVFLSRARLIPTAAAFDSFWDSQIGEILTRCLLLRKEQHRWVERLGSYGLI
jgi:hypothetical protein